MKHISLVMALILGSIITMTAQEKKNYSMYAIGFYNLENLFDTIHDEGKNDYEYLPNGANKWGELKYTNKLHNMARVLAEMGTDRIPVGCAAIGVSEVENAKCLSDLVNQPELKEKEFKFVHIEGPDRRGVDCALLYNPRLFKVSEATLVPYVPELEKDSSYVTRGFLTVRGQLAGEHVAIVVCHWPSRFVGSFYRETAGKQVKVIKDSLIKENPNIKVMVMGDMNDDPMDRSMAKALKAKPNIKEVAEDEMYNPWWKVLEGGNGTLRYDGSWNLFDQIVLSPSLLNQTEERDFSSLKYFSHQIFRRDYMIQSDGAYKGGPKRTHAGGVWHNGFSDHLPVVVYLLKEQDAVRRDVRQRLKEEEEIMEQQRLKAAEDNAFSELIEKAKAEGDSWDEEQWKSFEIDVVKSLKPIVAEIYNRIQEVGGERNVGPEDLIKMKKYESMMEELRMVIDSNETARKLNHDKEFQQELENIFKEGLDPPLVNEVFRESELSDDE